MASLHELHKLPKEGEYFLSFKDLLKVICDAFVKYKFSFHISVLGTVTDLFWTVTVDIALDSLRTHTGTQTRH
jgi:hypothetical protein